MAANSHLPVISKGELNEAVNFATADVSISEVDTSKSTEIQAEAIFACE